MKIIIPTLIICLLVCFFIGCTKQTQAPNAPGDQGQPSAQPANTAQDQAIGDAANISVGDNPDTGSLSAPDVDASGLA